MALAIRPLAPSKIILAATPYLSDTKEYWIEGLELFHRALTLKFVPGKLYGDFEVAEFLDVHRIIATEWMIGLVRCGLAEGIVKPISASLVDPDAAEGFILKPVRAAPLSIDVPDDLQNYNPWTNRELDLEVSDALMPDLFIDKYYLTSVDEHFIFRRKRRQRENGALFTPVPQTAMPRYENPAETRKYEGKSPPCDWQAIIDKAASEYDDD
jgi:hypothetical protein